jgi:predicted N-acetyltransferase YhbS
MRRAPDYRPDLDLAVLNGKGEVAAFATFWYDAVNRIGILEPLGTVPDHSRLGLASALLSEGINRLIDLGARRLYGGAGQEFYRKFGFEVVDFREIWCRNWEGSSG